MDLTALIVVIIGTLMFFGFAIAMAFYSRRNAPPGAQKTSESNNEPNLR